MMPTQVLSACSRCRRPAYCCSVPFHEIGMARTKAGVWLWRHAPEYGFILRYPQGKEKITGYAFEPWHFRYLGKAHSSHFKANSTLSLEEYLGLA